MRKNKDLEKIYNEALKKKDWTDADEKEMDKNEEVISKKWIKKGLY